MPKYTRWYKVGEVSLVRHSISVTGFDTHWNAAFIKPGDMFTPDDGQSFYEVFAVVDDTHLTLKTPYRGETVSNSGYGIVRQFNATTPAELASLMAYFQLVFDKYVDIEMQKITGKSAYDVACDAGFGGTVSEWLESLKAAGEWVLTQKKVDDLTVEAKTANRNIGDMSALSTDMQSTLVEAINEVDNHADTNAKNIGDFETLRTDAKDTIIKAINEVDEHTDDNSALIGDRTALNTDQKITIISALNEVDEHADTNTAHIGSMDALTTDSNITLVGAINEVDTHVDTNTTHIGEISALSTDAKATLVAAINEVDTHTDANTTKLNGIENGANKYTHPSYTARTGIESSNQTPAFGETFNISQVVSNGSGHVSNMNTRTVKIPNAEATTNAAGLMSASDKKKLNGIADNANNYTYSHPTYTAKTGVPTANQSPGFGGSFEVTQPVSDGSGHITALNSRTIYIPNSVATTSDAGLMSAADKKKLNISLIMQSGTINKSTNDEAISYGLTVKYLKHTVIFSTPFSTIPIVLLQRIGLGYAFPIDVAVSNISKTGFDALFIYNQNITENQGLLYEWIALATS